jgi:hypothetical protein
MIDLYLYPRNTRYAVTKDGRVYDTKEERWLNLWPNNGGYLYCKIQGKNVAVHRAVYETYVHKIERSIDVDHIDYNRQNNNLVNLQAITRSENLKRAVRDGRYKVGGKHHLAKKVIRVDSDGIETVYPCVSDAARELGLHRGAIANACLKGIPYSSGGYYWKYV